MTHFAQLAVVACKFASTPGKFLTSGCLLFANSSFFSRQLSCYARTNSTTLQRCGRIQDMSPSTKPIYLISLERFKSMRIKPTLQCKANMLWAFLPVCRDPSGRYVSLMSYEQFVYPILSKLNNFCSVLSFITGCPK